MMSIVLIGMAVLVAAALLAGLTAARRATATLGGRRPAHDSGGYVSWMGGSGGSDCGSSDGGGCDGGGGGGD